MSTELSAAVLTFLLSPEGQTALTHLPPISEQTHLAVAMTLRQTWPPDLANGLLEMALLRQKGTAKFSRAADMLFTRAGLEQASGEQIAAHHAQRVAQMGVRWVADLGCGIGGDALALAAVAHVIGVDLAAERLRMARHNAAVYGRATHFHPLQADLLTLPPLPVDALFCDPARRTATGQRILRVADYQPPLTFVARWREQTPSVAIKISPAVAEGEIPATAEAEFISVGGELKECVLWWGELHSGVNRRATQLPSGASMGWRPLSAPVPITPPRAYLYEPDPAILRAGLVEQLAEELGAAKISADIAYLTHDTAVPTPWARCFALEAWFPFQLKRLRHYLREQGIGRVTIKKRGSPLDVDWLQRQLRLKGGREAILFLTQVGGEAAVLVGKAE
ncbi:MAG: methyltransferase domain-containing protein [Chloroflexi bacterium]|nr:methyltransferase domain-containing protein [Chloroflexota bacterium]